MNDAARAVGPVKVNLGFHEATVAVVRQEAATPTKRTSTRIASASGLCSGGRRGEQMLIGVFDGHGPNGCASIAAHAFPDVLRRLRSDSSRQPRRAAPRCRIAWDADEALQSYSRAFVDTDRRVMDAGDGALLGRPRSWHTSSGTCCTWGRGGQHCSGWSRRGRASRSGSRRASRRASLVGAGPHWVLEVSHDQTCFGTTGTTHEEGSHQAVMLRHGHDPGRDAPERGLRGEQKPRTTRRRLPKGATFPGCAFTRSLRRYREETKVYARPELLTYQLDGTRCLILAFDGVFEFMTNEEVLAGSAAPPRTGAGGGAEIVATAYEHCRRGRGRTT